MTDYIPPTFDEKTELIKDINAGAVLLSAIYTAIILGFIYIPKILQFIHL